MKKFVFTLFLVCFSLLTYSQELNNKHFSPNAEGWLLDSVYHTCTEYGDQRMFRILKRNDSGFPLKDEDLDFNFTTNEYDVIYSSFYSYPSDADSNIFYRTVIYNDEQFEEQFDSVQYYTNNNDEGYKVESFERWHNGITWISGKKEKWNIEFTEPCFHYLYYLKTNETDDWILIKDEKAIFNNDSTILFEYSYSGWESTMDTISKSLTYYNDNNLPYDYNWFNKIDGEWELKNSIKTTYNENNQVISILEYRYYADEFRFDDKEIYEYDENGFLSSYQTFNWDRYENFWKFDVRDDYINDSNGNVLTEIKYRDLSDTAWKIRRKYDNVYNENNKLIQSEKSYPISDNIWRKENLINYTHQSEQYYSYERYLWDTLSSSYRNSHKTDRFLDEYNRLIKTQIHDAESPDFSWFLKNTYSNIFLENDNQFIKKEISYSHISEDTTELNIKYYNKLNTGLVEFETYNYSLFPNPASDVIYIQSEIFNSQSINYEIFNIKGQLIKSGSTNSRGNISVLELRNGMYLLKIYKPDNNIEILKFQKQK